MNGFAAIGLKDAKIPENVGHVLRAAHAYNASMVAISGKRYKRSATDTSAAYRHLPLIQCNNLYDVIPFDCVPVAVDLVEGARPLNTYIHPKSAFYIFGAEDQTLGREILKWCRDIIYIPTSICMNLSACVNVVLYDRLTKFQQNKTDKYVYKRTNSRSLEKCSI